MGAHVGQAPHGTLVVTSEHQRLAQTPVEQRERKHSSGRLHPSRIPYPLPAARKNAILLQLEILGVGVHPRRQRRRSADVLVDLEIASGHRLELTQSRVSLRSSVAEELPHIPHL